jgi:ribonuclease G
VTNEILINSTKRETRVAVVLDGKIQDLIIDRTSHRGLVGNIYLGVVKRVLPGMQAAFVEVGLSRTAFLHAKDTADGRTDILQTAREGQTLMVQVVKDPIGSKGARLTTRITLPSRLLVLLPDASGLAISSRIQDEAERERLAQVAGTLMESDAALGYIVRTVAEGASSSELARDATFLKKSWSLVKQRASGAKPGTLIHAEPPVAVRLLRDRMNNTIERVQVDEDSCLQQLKQFATDFLPDMEPAIQRYTDQKSIFELYSIEDEIQKALERQVDLKSGGYLIFDQTEAMTTVDVNTGAYI